MDGELAWAGDSRILKGSGLCVAKKKCSRNGKCRHVSWFNHTLWLSVCLADGKATDTMIQDTIVPNQGPDAVVGYESRSVRG